MELIWAAIKILEHLVLTPLWWVSTQLAAIFFPFEGDNKHDMLAMCFAGIIGMGLIGGVIWLCQ